MHLNKFLRSVTVALVCILFTGICFSAEAALDPRKNYDLTLKMQSPTVSEFTKTVTSKIGVLFSFDSSISGLRMEDINIDVKSQPLELIISSIFSTQLKGLSYEIVNDSIVIFYKEQVQDSGENRITGVILDDAGQPLMQAGVLVKGTDRGSVSDLDGHYEIDAEPGEVLVFSSLGFADQEIKVGASSKIDVEMDTDIRLLDEVVVVGYGTQKKVNLTGSVSMVNSEDMVARPVSDMSSALQGMLPGVTVVNPSGQPGSSNSTIRVRGIGTIGNSNPLVLVDGVEGDFSALNPEDIESVSVLKDAASSAIYGARAANGVLLVTTKNAAAGKLKKNKVTLGAYWGFQNPTRLPEMCNALEYMQLENEAKQNVGAPASWQQEQMDAVVNGSDPNNFSDTDWVDEVINKFALQQNYNLTLSGSFGNTGYIASYRYLDQKGLTVGTSTGEKRHNVRIKLNTKFFDRVTLNSNIGYISSKVNDPVNGLSSGKGALYQAMRIAPFAPLHYTDGSWGYGGGNTNPVAILHDGGWSKRNNEEFSVQEVLKIDILKGWDVSATYNMTSRNGFREIMKKTITFINPDTHKEDVYGAPNSLKNIDTRSIQQTFIAQTNFDFTFGKHNINGVVGMSQEWYEYKSFSASRSKMISEDNPALSLGDPSLMSNEASASTWAIRSGFGRFCYNYGDRYLIEANLRYDLSSRFAKENRGGWFPSVSGAWRLSEEKFMEPAKSVISNLKIRASWGMLGNQYVGSSNFPYLSVLESFTKDLSLIGGNPTNAYVQAILPNPALTWEKIQMFDVGFDMSLLDSRFNLTFDWFNKDTKDILLQLNYPDQLGAKPAEENAGKVNNKGWELDVSWRDQVGDFYYGIGFNLSDVKNKIVDLAGKAPDLSGYQIRRVGDPIDAFYGYVADGLMMPEDFKIYDESTDSYIKPIIPVLVGNNDQPGDIRYKDISGPKGVPDGRITPEYDRVVIGSNIPRYTYSIRGNLAWKGLDFSVVFQGVGKCDGYLMGSARHAFQDMAGYPQKVHLQRFNLKTNPDPHASYPRLTYNTSFNQDTFSTYWLEDASYFRLKNIQIGYTFPDKWMKKARISKLRVYFSGDNLFTASKFFYAYDPESPISKGGYYPQIRTAVFGINLSFE